LRAIAIDYGNSNTDLQCTYHSSNASTVTPAQHHCRQSLQRAALQWRM